MDGVPLLVQTFRSLGLPARIRKQVGVKQRERGLDEAEMVESFVELNAIGGECFDDYRKQQSGGLAQLWRERGYQMMLAVRAEMNVVVADEFRDGNVPAILDPLSVVKRSFAALPGTVSTFSIAATRRATSVTWSTGCGMRSGWMDHAGR